MEDSKGSYAFAKGSKIPIGWGQGLGEGNGVWRNIWGRQSNVQKTNWQKNDRDIFGTEDILAGLQECHIWISERREGNKAGNIGRNYL